jgi:hypothetical protein
MICLTFWFLYFFLLELISVLASWPKKVKHDHLSTQFYLHWWSFIRLTRTLMFKWVHWKFFCMSLRYLPCSICLPFGYIIPYYFLLVLFQRHGEKLSYSWPSILHMLRCYCNSFLMGFVLYLLPVVPYIHFLLGLLPTHLKKIPSP